MENILENTVLSEKIKPKSVIINGSLHYQLKTICKSKSLKLGAIIEDLILLYVSSPKHIQAMIDSLKEEIERIKEASLNHIK